ncbi:MAG: hypothetical protein IKH57_18050 [Clostridia bacterium]|nr:hypothetical protein [Clostridia bacterium]
MQEVYEEYRDRVAVIAISIEETDSVEKLAEYRESKGLTLPMAPPGATGSPSTRSSPTFP